MRRPNVGPFRDGAFTSPNHDERNAAILGLVLGVCFVVCFATGLLSHLIQNPPGWFVWPTSPGWGYRLSQGLHVATGLACIPLIAGKLWTVYPNLFEWPPIRSISHGVERLCLLALIGGALFLVFTGLGNINVWRPWDLNFRIVHYWTAWLVVGALLVHLGANYATTRRALSRPTPPDAGQQDGIDRRSFLGITFGAAGFVTLFTIGQTFRPLTALGFLAPRSPVKGPQGFPVNKTAERAGVEATARDATWRLRVTGKVRRTMEFSLDELRSLDLHEATLAIACVEGWSTVQRWKGVRVRDLLELAGADEFATARVRSFASGASRESDLNHFQAHDPDSLLAMYVNDEELHIDHGYPLRLIGPNRPGVQQTKWVNELRVL